MENEGSYHCLSNEATLRSHGASEGHVGSSYKALELLLAKVESVED